MEIEIYKPVYDRKIGIYENEYNARIIDENREFDPNTDPHCLALNIAHTIKDKYKNNLETLILEKGEGIEKKEIETIKDQIKKSASYKGYEINIK